MAEYIKKIEKSLIIIVYIIIISKIILYQLLYIVRFYLFFINKKEKMTLNRNESQFSSKELNKILPSYILKEIDKEHLDSESETQDTNKIVSLIL